MQIGPILRSLIGFAVVTAACACAGTYNDGAAEEASGLTAQQLADIPVPQGLELSTDLHQSHSFESGRFRIADLHYFGNLPIEEVAGFMRDGMRLRGWRLVDDQASPDRIELAFERRPNRTRCLIWRDDSSVTRMHVEVRTPPGEE